MSNSTPPAAEYEGHPIEWWILAGLDEYGDDVKDAAHAREIAASMLAAYTRTLNAERDAAIRERDLAVAALRDAQSAICSEYCGTTRHHDCCKSATDALRALTQAGEAEA